jgi:hypothetical protein
VHACISIYACISICRCRYVSCSLTVCIRLALLLHEWKEDIIYVHGSMIGSACVCRCILAVLRMHLWISWFCVTMSLRVSSVGLKVVLLVSYSQFGNSSRTDVRGISAVTRKESITPSIVARIVPTRRQNKDAAACVASSCDRFF